MPKGEIGIACSQASTRSVIVMHVKMQMCHVHSVFLVMIRLALYWSVSSCSEQHSSDSVTVTPDPPQHKLVEETLHCIWCCS